MRCANCPDLATAKVSVILAPGDDPYTWYMCERHARPHADAAVVGVDTRVEPVGIDDEAAWSEPDPFTAIAGPAHPVPPETTRIALQLVLGSAAVIGAFAVAGAIAAAPILVPVVALLVVLFGWTARF
jgi:hypothetical protein